MNNPWVKKTNDDRIDHQIEQVLKYFAFKFVHQAMTALNWTWATLHGVPSIDDLKDQAERLLTEAAEGYLKNKEDTWFVSCGGLKATCKEGVLRLEFVCDEWEFVGDTPEELKNNTLEK